MENLKFKTNLNCGGCVFKVQADLNSAPGISEWSVDIQHSDKILTVKSQGISEAEVVNLIKKKGFVAEAVEG